jgi:hypothetical protein
MVTYGACQRLFKRFSYWALVLQIKKLKKMKSKKVLKTFNFSPHSTNDRKFTPDKKAA